MIRKNNILLILIVFVIFIYQNESYENITQKPGRYNRSRKKLRASEYRVAFIFAGSVRSFIFPYVHESIRNNLIRSFCPLSYCIGDVFLRLSTSDNTHLGPDAKGVATFSDSTILNKLHIALRRLQPNRGGQLFHEEVNIASRKESVQMDRITSNSFWLDVYRNLDSRRFSMYFNRYMAYQMALKQQEETGIEYDWFVHARLDMAWGAPIKPVNIWSPLKMWVPDSWHADVPDTFALLPKNLSDSFYSMTKMYENKQAACLGGPNFNPKTIEANELLKFNYNDTEIKLIIGDVCLNKYSYDKGIYNKETGITWTTAGDSEVQLKRKLKYQGIEYLNNKGKLGFSSFFTVVVRTKSNYMLCNYLQTDNFIPWSKDYQHTSSPLGPACHSFSYYMHQMELYGYSSCNSHFQSSDVESLPSSSSRFHNHLRKFSIINNVLTPEDQFKKDSYHIKHNLMIKFPLISNNLPTIGGIECLLDHDFTDWNFMPFRIRIFSDKKPKCITHDDSFTKLMKNDLFLPSTDIQIKECIKTELVNRNTFTGDYSNSQLFHFFPLVEKSQRILHWDVNHKMTCLTITYNENSPLLIQMSECEQDSSKVSQLFSFIRIDVELNNIDNNFQFDGFEDNEYNKAFINNIDKKYNTPRIKNVRNRNADPSKEKLGIETITLIKWMGNGATDCLTITNSNEKDSKVLPSFVFNLQPCYFEKNEEINFNIDSTSLLILERTVLKSKVE
jgi:hypothetical protein